MINYFKYLNTIKNKNVNEVQKAELATELAGETLTISFFSILPFSELYQLFQHFFKIL